MTWTFHPVPVALSEVSYLAHVEQTTVTRDLERVGLTARVPLTARAPANPQFHSRFTEHLALPARVHGEDVATCFERRAQRPRWELLRPSVVIRRRPQRD